MPETSTPTLTPDGTTKLPAFQNNNPGNVEVDALKAYILSQAGLANGLATLDAEGKLDSSQIPVNLDDVLVYASYASLPATGETGKLYITSDVNGTYYWNGTSYQILNQSFVRYRGSLSSLPSDAQPGDWFIAASSFSSYTSGHIYLYNGSSWDDVTAVFGQFVLKTDIAQTLGQQTDKVPSNKAVDDAINAINTRVTNIEETLIGENEVTVQYPDDGNYSSLMPNRVPLRALKFAEVKTLKGKTRAWNQLIGTNYSARGNTTITIDSDGYFCLSVENWTSGTCGISFAINFDSTHKYLTQIHCKDYSLSETVTCRLASDGNTTMCDGWQSTGGSGCEIQQPNANSTTLRMYFTPVTNAETLKFKILVRDLTPIFPDLPSTDLVTSNIPNLVKRCPDLLKYDAYDAGSLVDTEVSGVKSVGVNLFDKDGTFVDAYCDGGGTFYGNHGTLNAKSVIIKVKSGQTYYFNTGNKNGGMQRCAFTREYPTIGDRIYNASGVSSFETYTNGWTVTVPTGFMYMIVTFFRSDVSNDGYDNVRNALCINVSDNSINGQYYPYKTDTLSLSETVTLKSAGSVADERHVERGVETRKVGRYTFDGSENWNFYTSPDRFALSFVQKKVNGAVLCDKYTSSDTLSGDKIINGDASYITIIDSTYNGDTLAQFKAHLAGMTLNYELATPTTESIDPVPYNFLEVEGGGTVETIQTQSPVIDNCLDVTYDIIPQ